MEPLPRRPALGRRVKDIIGNLKRRKPVKVETLQQFQDEVDSENDNIVAVMFHAKYCKACAAALPHFYKLAGKYPAVKFVDVPISEKNHNLLEQLGVRKFPFGHIYHPRKGLLDELPLLRKFVPQFEEQLLWRIDGDETTSSTSTTEEQSSGA